MKSCVIFASGRGSNFDAILASVASGKCCVEVRGLVCNQPGAPILEQALQKNSHNAFHVLVSKEPSEWLSACQGVDLVVLAGFMKILPPSFIEALRDPTTGYSRIVNIHPSLLPAFPGLDAYDQAFRAGVHWSGVSVHLVEAAVDSGPILAQDVFYCGDCSTVEELKERGLAVEHRLYPKIIDEYLNGKTSWKGGRCVRKN